MQALSGEIAHLVSNNREPSSLGARPRGLDGGDQGDEIGEVRDLSDGSDESRDSCGEGASATTWSALAETRAPDPDVGRWLRPMTTRSLPAADSAGGGSARLRGLGTLVAMPGRVAEEIGWSKAPGSGALPARSHLLPHAMGGSASARAEAW